MGGAPPNINDINKGLNNLVTSKGFQFQALLPQLTSDDTTFIKQVTPLTFTEPVNVPKNPIASTPVNSWQFVKVENGRMM